MGKDKRCKCTFTQSLVGDGCRYCQPQEYIDMLRDEIKDNQEECENLKHDLDGYMEANKALVIKQWQGLTEEEINSLKLLRVSEAIIRAIEQALKEKNEV
jgi:hypothetical protein